MHALTHASPTLLTPLVTVTTASTTHSLCFIVGASQALPHLDAAVQGLLPGDTASAVSPSGASQTVRVERVTPALTDLPHPASRADLLASAEALRQDANALFAKAGDDFRNFKAAMLMYNRALDAVRLAGGDAHMQVRLRNNLALCALRTSEWTAAVVQCDAVLEIDPRNGKALYRRALAEVEMDMFVRALSDMRKAAELCPEDAVVRATLKRLESECRKTLEKRKGLFAQTYNYMPTSKVFAQVIPE